MQEQTIGELLCRIVDGGPAPTIPVVLCHGFGAPGEDLVSMSAYLIQMLGEAAPRFRFVFPEAPLSLADEGLPGGRAWWSINMQRLMQLIQANDFSELRTEEPPGIDEAREKLTKTINEVVSQMDASTYVIGGFSQGAMLTMDATLRGLSTPPAGLCQYSGTLICEPVWQSLASNLIGTSVVQTHGTLDSVLPHEGATLLQELLSDSAKSWEFASFEGPHTIPIESYQLTTKMLLGLAEKAH